MYCCFPLLAGDAELVQRKPFLADETYYLLSFVARWDVHWVAVEADGIVKPASCSFGMVAFVETTRSSRSIFQKHTDKRQYDAPARLWDSLGALRVAAGRLKSITFAPQDNPGAVSFGHPMRLLSWFCAPSMARWPVWARTRLLDPATEPLWLQRGRDRRDW